MSRYERFCKGVFMLNIVIGIFAVFMLFYKCGTLVFDSYTGCTVTGVIGSAIYLIFIFKGEEIVLKKGE